MNLIIIIIGVFGFWSWVVLGLILFGLEIIVLGIVFLWFGILVIVVGIVVLLFGFSW